MRKAGTILLGPYQTFATDMLTKTFAGYTALKTLPQVDLDVTVPSRLRESEGFTTVPLHNPSRTLAFTVRLKVNKASSGQMGHPTITNDEVLPVLGDGPLLSAAARRELPGNGNVQRQGSRRVSCGRGGRRVEC